MAVELDNVTKTYGAVRALLGVTARFAEGAVSMVLGDNGSGKSTLLSLVGTLARPTTGVVRHGSLGATRAEVRATLGWLGHDALCYPDLSGRENLVVACKLHGMAPSVLSDVMERFQLGAFAERPFRTYSRGQRQRVALARALVHRPKLLLLDEPTTGLDASGVARLRQVIEEEAARGATVLVVTHDLAFAEIGAAKLVLERGRIKSE